LIPFANRLSLQIPSIFIQFVVRGGGWEEKFDLVPSLDLFTLWMFFTRVFTIFANRARKLNQLISVSGPEKRPSPNKNSKSTESYQGELSHVCQFAGLTCLDRLCCVNPKIIFNYFLTKTSLLHPLHWAHTPRTAHQIPIDDDADFPP
jgi:hypothetical protein